MKILRLVVLLVVAFATLTACAPSKVTKVDVQSYEMKKRVSVEDAFRSLSAILVEQGFDIKLTNKDSGILSTEYKKFASAGVNPPFDYYLQIKAIVKPNEGKIILTPIVKEQNRTNFAAFTEHELSYYKGEPVKIQCMNFGWATSGQTLFMNVVGKIAEAFGIGLEEIKKNETETAKSGFVSISCLVMSR